MALVALSTTGPKAALFHLAWALNYDPQPSQESQEWTQAVGPSNTFKF